MTYQDRSALRLHPAAAGHLTASVHGAVDADTAQKIADRLAELLHDDIREAHIDVDQANPLSAAAAAILFFAVLRATRTGNPPIPVTVHRADTRTRSHLRELGLDQLLAYSDQTP
jgi:anti-anti-sigma regulatory factor